MANVKLAPVPGPSAQSFDESDDDLWDVDRAARYLGMSRHYVYRASERGDLPYRKIGSRLRFVPAELKNWAHKQGGGT